MDRRNCSTDDRRRELRLRRLPAADGRLPLLLQSLSLSLSNQYADAGGNGDDSGESESATTAVAFAGDSERGGIRSAPAPLAPMPTVAGDSGAASPAAVALPSLPDFVEAVGLKGALTDGLACRLAFADADLDVGADAGSTARVGGTAAAAAAAAVSAVSVSISVSASIGRGTSWRASSAESTMRTNSGKVRPTALWKLRSGSQNAVPTQTTTHSASIPSVSWSPHLITSRRSKNSSNVPVLPG